MFDLHLPYFFPLLSAALPEEHHDNDFESFWI